MLRSEDRPSQRCRHSPRSVELGAVLSRVGCLPDALDWDQRGVRCSPVRLPRPAAATAARRSGAQHAQKRTYPRAGGDTSASGGGTTGT